MAVAVLKCCEKDDFSLIATSNFGDHETDTPIHYEIFTQSRQARKELLGLYFASLAPLREP